MKPRLYLLLFVAGAIGLVFVLPKPNSPLAPRASGETVPWSIPEARANPANVKVPVALPEGLFGSFVTPTATAVDNTPKTWKIVGVVRQPKEPFALLSFDGREPEVRKLGDLLPGGSTLAAVGTDHICVYIDGDKRKRRMLLLSDQ